MVGSLAPEDVVARVAAMQNWHDLEGLAGRGKAVATQGALHQDENEATMRCRAAALHAAAKMEGRGVNALVM